ncbi:hypothetical protein DUNSADRAFT_18038 [Dunaliella salina]|uniref:Uncharacterized protein n=1 Tax=Dunaliella salina TaxID=3046 RepID=A0ABQ7GZM0_DUNSA|nr:hypothetical protein DUNSADRAFT_18038 [Dunaliella salina]|eukprot:KAF5840001.1 hypothetical protein DUNSADRAFT_18038 [Dunaliella salina]
MQDPSQSAAAIQQQQQILLAQMMGGTGRMLPLPYLTTQATQFSQPLRYPDHDQLMQAVYLDEFAQKLTDPRDKKNAVRQAKAFKLQLKQALKYKEKMQTSFRNATLAGSKITPEPPNLATKRPPSVQPPCTYRYRVPEPAGGWLVRPQLEPHGTQCMLHLVGNRVRVAPVRECGAICMCRRMAGAPLAGVTQCVLHPLGIPTWFFLFLCSTHSLRCHCFLQLPLGHV